jgi:anti-sigma factor RsiW
MPDIWTDRLSEYLDGDLTGSDRADLECHLETCADCRQVLEELSRVLSSARSLSDVPPAVNLWAGIATAIASASSVRKVSFSLPQLIAASVLLSLVSGLSVWIWLDRGRPDGATLVRSSAHSAGRAGSTAHETYDRAVADLLQAVDEGRDRLGPRTVEVLVRSLGTIDRAIGEARAALEKDPENAFLSVHLVRERQRKLAVLRQLQNFAEPRVRASQE